MALIVNGTPASESSSAADIIDEGMTAVLAGEARGTTVVSDGDTGIELMRAASATSVDYDFSSTTGWTLSALESATAAFASNLATFTAPSGVNVAVASRARATIPLATVGVANPWRVAAEARLAAFDASGSRRAVIVLSSVANGMDSALYGSTDAGLFVILLESSITIYDVSGGAALTLRTTSAQSASLDGQDWFRVEMRGTEVELFFGRGSTRPTSWDRIASAVLGGTGTNLAMKAPSTLTLGAYRSDTTASVFTASWADLRVTDLP